MSTLDEQFFAELQGKQQSGELSKEEFSQLLQSYMTNMDSVKRGERQKKKAKLNRVSNITTRWQWYEFSVPLFCINI